MMDVTRAVKASCRIAALYCVFVLLVHDIGRVSAPVTNNSQQSRNLRNIFHRLLHSSSSTSSLSSRRRTLLGSDGVDFGRGPGLWAVPDLTPSTTGTLGFMSAAQESSAPESVAVCPSGGKVIATGLSPSSTRTPTSWAWDGSALAWGSPVAPPKDGPAGAVGTVYLLDELKSCNFTQGYKLSNPVGLLPLNYNLEADKDTGAPILAQVSVSGNADVVLVATRKPAVYTPPKPSSVQTESGGAIPYILAAFSYRKYLKPNTTRPVFIPAGVLPIPAVSVPNVTVTGLSVSLDGKTALVCVMPDCTGPNPSACGSGWAHLFRMSATAAASTGDIGGHTWNLIAQLPFAGYGTPGGHGVSCSLSLDGGTAAVLAASTVVGTVPVPVASSSNSSSSSSSSGGSSNRRLLQLSGGNSDAQYTTVVTTTRNAYLQMYAATSANGPWAAVGTQLLDPVIADCILGAVSCRPMVDVSDRFAAVAYMSGPELKSEVVFHNAPQAAASKKWVEFVKVCTLSKLMARLDDTSSSKANQIDLPQPSADQIATVAIRQPTGTLALRIMVATRNPGALYLWSLSRRGEQACPASPKNLLEDKGLNPTYAPLPLLTADVSGDGLLAVVTGQLDGDGLNRLVPLGSY